MTWLVIVAVTGLTLWLASISLARRGLDFEQTLRAQHPSDVGELPQAHTYRYGNH